MTLVRFAGGFWFFSAGKSVRKWVIVKNHCLAYTKLVIQHEKAPMKIFLPSLALMLAASTFAQAQSDVYLCIDANGKKEYKNTGVVKGCKLVDLPRSNSVPSPPSAKKNLGKPASVPADFPKVDDSTQRARDSDRKQILMDELKVEEQKLANLKKEFNNGEVERRADERLAAQYVERVNNLKSDVERTGKNIEALKREISNLK